MDVAKFSLDHGKASGPCQDMLDVLEATNFQICTGRRCALGLVFTVRAARQEN